MSKMNKQDIDLQILRAAYEAHFFTDDAVLRNRVAPPETYTPGNGTILLHETVSVDNASDYDLIGNLLKEGLMQSWGRGDSYKITGSGLLYCENEALVEGNTIEHNSHERLKILEALITWYDANKDRPLIPADERDKELLSRSSGSQKSIGVHIMDLASELNRPMAQLIPHLDVLSALGYIQAIGIDLYVPTSEGRHVKRYEDMRDMPSRQLRGREFQRLVADVIGQQGWTQSESVQTSNEEIDVIIHRERDYYLIECKWEKDPAEASVVGELLRKMSNRPRVDGLLLSMSGFTSGAVEQVKVSSTEHRILLFGPQDIRTLIYGEARFDSLLSDKLEALIQWRRVEFR